MTSQQRRAVRHRHMKAPPGKAADLAPEGPISERVKLGFDGAANGRNCCCRGFGFAP